MKYDPARDHYVTLEIHDTATEDVIKKAHRRLIKSAHPDTEAGDGERATALNVARDVLLEPTQRAAYDAARRAYYTALLAPPPLPTALVSGVRKVTKRKVSPAPAPVVRQASADAVDFAVGRFIDNLENGRHAKAAGWFALGVVIAAGRAQRKGGVRSTPMRARRRR